MILSLIDTELELTILVPVAVKRSDPNVSGASSVPVSFSSISNALLAPAASPTTAAKEGQSAFKSLAKDIASTDAAV